MECVKLKKHDFYSEHIHSGSCNSDGSFTIQMHSGKCYTIFIQNREGEEVSLSQKEWERAAALLLKIFKKKGVENSSIENSFIDAEGVKKGRTLTTHKDKEKRRNTVKEYQKFSQLVEGVGRAEASSPLKEFPKKVEEAESPSPSDFSYPLRHEQSDSCGLPPQNRVRRKAVRVFPLKKSEITGSREQVEQEKEHNLNFTHSLKLEEKSTPLPRDTVLAKNLLQKQAIQAVQRDARTRSLYSEGQQTFPSEQKLERPTDKKEHNNFEKGLLTQTFQTIEALNSHISKLLDLLKKNGEQQIAQREKIVRDRSELESENALLRKANLEKDSQSREELEVGLLDLDREKGYSLELENSELKKLLAQMQEQVEQLKNQKLSSASALRRELAEVYAGSDRIVRAACKQAVRRRLHGNLKAYLHIEQKKYRITAEVEKAIWEALGTGQQYDAVLKEVKAELACLSSYKKRVEPQIGCFKSALKKVPLESRGLYIEQITEIELLSAQITELPSDWIRRDRLCSDRLWFEKEIERRAAEIVQRYNALLNQALSNHPDIFKKLKSL